MSWRRPKGTWALGTRLANDAKIVRSRDAQCNTKELPKNSLFSSVSRESQEER